MISRGTPERGPLRQEAGPYLGKSSQLVLRKVASRALELCLPLVVRGWRLARGLKLREGPVERHPGRGAVERPT